jgi:hypothetical protein
MEKEMDRACGTHRGEDKYMQDFSKKARMKETTRKN